MSNTYFLPLLVAATFWSAGALRAGTAEKLQLSKKHLVRELPGWQGPTPSKQYTGYIPVHDENHRLFYWLVESEISPRSDPVVLWLTGGPGCSSMDAFVYEHGPFIFSSGGKGGIKLSQNPYSWSRAATMIYVDSPVGAGLSYSVKEKNPHMDDDRTTDDLVEFITQLLLEVHPGLADNDLYIAGESYAGVYVPLLATKLLDYNKNVPKQEQLNLKGYSVGNGVADDEFDGNGQPEFAFGFGLIDPPTYTQLKQACNDCFWNATKGGACAKQLNDAYDRFFWLNPYDILDDCFVPPRNHMDTPQRLQMVKRGTSAQDFTDKAKQWPQQSSHPIRAALEAQAHGSRVLSWPLSGVRSSASVNGQHTLSWHGLLGHTVPCADRRLSLTYFNRDAVREALHAPPVASLDWQPCSDVLHYDIQPISMLEYHKTAVEAGLRVLIYSGDHDFVVPFTGTRAWVYSLGLTPAESYAPWTVEGQVAGFLIKFKEGLQFATVKGAGHMVPQSSPERALHLITRFLFSSL